MKTTELSKTGKPVITMTVIKEDTGYSALTKVGNNNIFTQGETFDELKANIIEVVNLTFEDTEFSYTIDEILFSFDKSEYNSWKETFHLTSSKTNRARLAKSVKNINSKTGLERHNLVGD